MARINSRSSAPSSVPDTPVMNARVFMGPISPPPTQGSRKPRSIPLDDALSAGCLQTAAELRGLIGRPERTDHGAVVDALVAEVGALDHRAARSQHRRELALQGPERGLGVGFIALRGDLDQVVAASSTATRRGFGSGLHRGGGGYPGAGLRGRRRLIPCGASDSGPLALALAVDG